MESVRLSRRTCPLVFKNAEIVSIEFRRINFAFINYNAFGFMNNLKDDYNLNSKIEIIIFTGYKTILDNVILNEKVFERILFIEIGGKINNVDQETFKSFVLLKILRFKLQNFKLFFSNNLKWLHFLNLGVKVNYNDSETLKPELFLMLSFYQVFNKIIRFH